MQQTATYQNAAPVAAFRASLDELRPLLGLALPVVAAELGWMAMWLVDSMIVGRVGAEAIGAVSIGGHLFFAVAIFGMGTLLGLDFLVAHAFGGGSRADAHRALVAGVQTSLVLTVVLTALIAVAIPYLPATGVRPEILAQAVPYLVATTWSLLPLLLFATLRRYLQALGRVTPIMLAIVSANVVNAVACWALVFGHLGAPALGAVGAGWATAAARIYMLVCLTGYLVWYTRRHDPALRRVRLRPDPAVLRRLFRLGLPAALQTTLEVGVFAVATVLAGRLEPRALAAHQLALSAAAIAFMVPLGISSAAAVRVAQALGRGDGQRATQAGHAALVVAMLVMATSALVFMTVPRAILRVFTTDVDVITTGASLLVVAAIFQLFDGVQVVATGVLRGTGDTRTPMIANLVGHWALGLPIGCVLCFGFGWGVVGLWVGLTLGLAAVAVTLLTVWLRRAPRIAA